MEWGGLDAFNEGTDRKKKLTSVFHGFEHAMRTRQIKSWKDIKPVLEMLREVPGFGRARVPDDVGERHVVQAQADKERENLTPEKVAPKEAAARAEEPKPAAREPEGPSHFFDDEYDDFAFSDRSSPDFTKSEASDEKTPNGSPFKLAYRTERHGLPISVENRKGSKRRWVDRNGDEGSTKMRHAYGYIRGTHGADNDEIDCFLGPDANASQVYIVHQRIRSEDGTKFYGHDEDKVMMGFSSEREAKRAYLVHYNDERFLGSMTTMPVEKFKRVLEANKGKRLRIIKSLDPGELTRLEKGGHYGVRDALDVALLPNMAPPSPFLNIVQGTDDVPVKTRASHMTGIAQEMGYTADGRRRAKKKDSAEDARRRSRTPAGRFWSIEGVSHTEGGASYESASDYVPEMLTQFRQEARENAVQYGRDKREKNIARYRLRGENSRVSDLTRDQRMATNHAADDMGPHDVKIVKSLELHKSAGPFIGPRGGKWADAAHTVPWHEDHKHIPHEDIKESAPQAVHDEVKHAAHMAVAAGADPKSLKYVGAGGEGIVFEDNKGRAYKVARFRKKEKLRNEAEAMKSLEGTPAAKYVPKVHAFKHGVIVRDKVEGKTGAWAAGDKIRPVYDAIVAALKEKDWSAPEYKEDSFIFDEKTGDPTMIDLGFIHPRGPRAAARLDEDIANLTTKSDFLHIQFEQANLYNEGHLSWEKAKAQIGKIEEVFGADNPDVKYLRREMERRAEKKGDL
jgi:hypothetical protein